MLPAAEDLEVYVGRAFDDAGKAQARAALEAVGHMVRAYTRGHGFDEIGDPSADLGAVIVSASARLMANPEFKRSDAVGPFQVSHGTFDGWTLPELAILHAYRRRTA